jgi:peptidoglycan hydrolase-like protein with peptidoglycan-binding domain
MASGLAVAQFASQASQAQSNPAGVFGVIGGMIAAAQAQAAKEAWAAQPEMRLYCVKKALARHNTTIAGLVQAGVMPSDSRLHSSGTECARFEPSALKAKYGCTIQDESGWTVPSTCNQAFGRQDGSGVAQPTDLRTAIDLYFANGAYFLVDVESDAGRQQRQQQAERQRQVADLTSLRGDIEGLLSSRAGSVRIEAQKLATRASAAVKSKTGPSGSEVAAIRRDYKALARFNQAETKHLATLDELHKARSAVEQKMAGDLPQDVRQQFDVLQVRYGEVAHEAAPVFALERAEQEIGPSYDCSKAKDPLGTIICSDGNLRRLDVDLLRPYYVLRHSMPEQRDAMKQEAVAFTQSVLQTCRISEKKTPSKASSKQAASCVAQEYRRQRDLWQEQVERIAPFAARAEIGRTLDEHVELQKFLQDAGFIAPDEKVDGVYGVATRNAISLLQAAEGIKPDGILSDFTAERLVQRVADSAPGSTSYAGSFAAMTELTGQYRLLAERLDSLERQRALEQKLLAEIAQADSYARSALVMSLPAHTKALLTGLLDDIAKVRSNPDIPSLERVASSFRTMKVSVDGDIAVQGALTANNRFILDGEPNEVLVLYNDTSKAPSLVKNLKGDFVFQGGRTSVCQPHGGAPRPDFVKLTNARLATTGQSFEFPLSRCGAELGSYDLIVLAKGLLQTSDSPFDLVTLLKAVGTGMFKPMFSIGENEVKAAADMKIARIREMEERVQTGAAQGFGIVTLANTSANVCQAVEEEKEVHTLALQSTKDQLAEDLGKSLTFEAMSLENAFISAKRGGCAAIYASASDLKSLTAALKRDQVQFHHLLVWVDQERLAKVREMAKVAEAEAKARAEREAEAKKVAEEKALQEAVARAKAEVEAKVAVQAAANASSTSMVNVKQPVSAPQAQAATLPRDQTDFIGAVDTARTAYRSGSNDLAKGAARPSRRQAICSALSSLAVQNWVGTVESLSSNQDGLGVLSIKIGKDIYMKTWNNFISDADYDTLIDPSSRVFQTAMGLKKGDQVRFSGYLFPDEVDCVKESSVSLSGSMYSPEFILRFSDLSR